MQRYTSCPSLHAVSCAFSQSVHSASLCMPACSHAYLPTDTPIDGCRGSSSSKHIWRHSCGRQCMQHMQLQQVRQPSLLLPAVSAHCAACISTCLPVCICQSHIECLQHLLQCPQACDNHAVCGSFYRCSQAASSSTAASPSLLYMCCIQIQVKRCPYTGVITVWYQHDQQRAPALPAAQ